MPNPSQHPAQRGGPTSHVAQLVGPPRPVWVRALICALALGLVLGVSGCKAAPAADDAIARAFANQQSGVQVSGQGTVTEVLPDDDNGSRHQRFILRLASGQTVLVAHNIDIAPRVPSLAVGDAIAFYGVYEWSSKGGTIHWTHHDPDGSHVAGWLKRGGSVYQ